MKLKLAAIAMIASVALSCNTSFGCELLDRMLGRAGCSSCQAPKAPSCGCGGGLMDKIMGKSAGCGCGGSDMLTYNANMDCGPVGSPCQAAADCGCSAPAPVADCGCSASAAPASPCGGGGGCGLLSKLTGSLSGGGCGCGSPAPVSDCGCSASAPAPAADCGCSAPAAPASPCGGGGGCGLLSKLTGSLGGGGCGCGSPAVADCGCSAPAPAPAPVADCGCSAPASPCGGGGGSLFSKISGSLGGGCGCSAPAPAPAAGCGCGSSAPAIGGGCGLGKGLFSKFLKPSCGSPAPVSGCGCSSPAPVVSTCGCNAPISGGCGSTIDKCGPRGELTLLDRLRGNRIPRTKEGVVIGACNDGCNPPCPAQPTPAPAGDCGCGAPSYETAAPYMSSGQGEVIYGDAQPYDSGCSTCQGSTQGQIIYGDSGAVAAPVIMDSNGATNVDPVNPVDTNSTEGVIESGGGSDAVEAAVDAVQEASPTVDPGAFVSPRRTTVGS